MTQGRRRTRLFVLTVTGVLALMLLGGGAQALAAPGVVQNLPQCTGGSPGGILPANDDGSTAAIPLGFTAHLPDQTFTSVFVNNNGNVTVGQAQSDFTPSDVREANRPIFAPFFADVDTRGEGNGLVKYGAIADFGGAEAFCVTWDSVGYYSARTDKRNRFQLIIVDRGTAGIDLIFNYDSMLWETGEADGGTAGLGGTSAAVGYGAGDGDSSHALLFAGSFQNGALIDGGPNSLSAGSTAGQPAGRYLLQVRETAPTGARVTGIVFPPGGTSPAAQAPVQLCRRGGACVTRISGDDGRYNARNLPAGTYDIKAFPPESTNYSPTTVSGVVVGGVGTQTNRNVTLGPPPPPPPAGTTIAPNNNPDPEDVPAVFWSEPLTLATQGCAAGGGSAHYTVTVEGFIQEGDMTLGADNVFSAVIPPFSPHHGTATVHITKTCDTGPENIDFGLYIDPSGVVRNPDGSLAADVTVTLLRSSTADGPFFGVPDGSAVMSPSNRNNPSFTGADGHFGWDVVAGYYVVRARRGDCTAESRIMTIPPPVTDLDLRLACPPPPPPPPPPLPRALASYGKAKLVGGKKLVVRVKCAATAVGTCAGRMSAKIRKKGVGKKAFKNVKPGKGKKVTIKLNKKGRAAVKKVKKGKKVKFKLTTTVKDSAGAGKTVRKTIKIKVKR